MIEFGKEKENIFTMPFLINQVEEDDNILKIRVALPKRGTTDSELYDVTDINLKNILKNATPIIIDTNKIYEIVFDSYIFHVTRNESYVGMEPREIHKGKYFVIYQKSIFLEWMPQLVECGLVDTLYPDGYVHYGINCQNHIIDIIATDKPEIRKVIN